MGSFESRLVPKVHPAMRAIEPDDPAELHATVLTGDPEIMLECLLQEYAMMGWDAPQILRLFYDPGYPALNALLEHHGEPGIRRRLSAVVARTGVFRVSGTVREESEPGDDEPEPIPLGTRRVLAPKGDRHAEGL